jgi:hypothetical protein
MLFSNRDSHGFTSGRENYLGHAAPFRRGYYLVSRDSRGIGFINSYQYLEAQRLRS